MNAPQEALQAKLDAARETHARALRQDDRVLQLRAAICFYRLLADAAGDCTKEQLEAVTKRIEAEEEFDKLAGRRFNLYQDFVGLDDIPSEESDGGTA